MWELCICAQSEIVAKFVFLNLKAEAEALQACVTCYQEDAFYILFACPVQLQQTAKGVIENCVAQVICQVYKDVFLSKNLRFPILEDLSKTAFKKALINFDKETDFFLISKNLQLGRNLNLDSFYLFRLSCLRQKWDELVCLANENCDYLASSDAFFDLLNFLIENLTTTEEEISVFKDEQGYVLKKAKKSLQAHLSKEALVGSLIDLCPKKINFCCANDEVFCFLSKIFGERVLI